MAKDTKKKYVVTQTGMQNREGGGEYEIGDVIDLTETQADARVGKVVLKSKAGESTPAPEANNKLVETVTEQAGQISDLTAQVETLTAESAEQAAQVETLTAENAEQAAQVETLTAANTALTEAAEAAKAEAT